MDQWHKISLATFVVLLLGTFGANFVFSAEAEKVMDQKENIESVTIVEEDIEIADAEIKLSDDEAAPVIQAAGDLIRDEIKAAGSFEVDDPETGDLLNLQFTEVAGDVIQVIDGEYLLKGNFTDKDNKKYGVGIYLEKLEDGTYEIVDAVVEVIDGKPVFE